MILIGLHDIAILVSGETQPAQDVIKIIGDPVTDIAMASHPDKRRIGIRLHLRICRVATQFVDIPASCNGHRSYASNSVFKIGPVSVVDGNCLSLLYRSASANSI